MSNTMAAALDPARSRHRRRVFTLTLAAALGTLLALTSAASADLLTPESGGSSNADSIDTLYKVVLGVAIVVFVGVEGALLYCLIKFRARKGAVAAQIRGNTKLEIGWTVGAAVILVVLAVVTFAMLGDIRSPPNSDADGFATQPVQKIASASAFQPIPPDGKALNIKVNGQQYVWRYTYPDSDQNNLNNIFSYEELVVPTKTTVTLEIAAQDVAHSWWVPRLGGKFDAVPGHLNFTWFKISKPGVFRGQCAELCGRNHADMVSTVRAIEPAQFKLWLAEKKREIQAANTLAQKRRSADARASTSGTQASGAGAKAP
jgi:cytochrome c oxidase subunit 2